jgi:hypothetical protein
MKIRFTRAYTVRDVTGMVYAEGAVLDCSDATARHFISRGAAIAVAAPGDAQTRRQANVQPPRAAVVEPGEPIKVAVKKRPPVKSE